MKNDKVVFFDQAEWLKTGVITAVKVENYLTN